MKQIPHWTFRLLQLTLPHVSRAKALYASHVIDFNFVTAIRTAATKDKAVLKTDRKLTRDAFAESVAEIIKRHKVPVERKKFADALKKDNVAIDAEFANVAKKYSKDTSNGDAGDQFRDWLIAEKKVSPETGEIGKNYVNWIRAGDGGYKGVLIKMLGEVAAHRAGVSGLDQDYVEAELASTYALEALQQKEQIENSPYVGSYLGWIRNHLRLRGMWHSAPKQTRFKTTLDMPYNEGSGDDGDEEDTFGESLGQSDSRNVKDLDMNDPEVRDLISDFSDYIRKHEPEHEEGIYALLEELLDRRSWSLPSDLVKDDPEFAEDVMQAKPGFNKAKWDAKHSHLSEAERKEKFDIDARVYVYKYLYPRLINLAASFFSKSKDEELKATLKRWVNEMNESKHKAEALAKLKDVPLYEYVEEMKLEPGTEKDEEGFLKSELKKRKKLRRVSSLSAQLLRRVASVDEPELVVEKLAGEEGALKVFERGAPRFAHVFRYEASGDQHVFDVPVDADQNHVFEAVRACRSFLASVSSEI